MFPSVKGPDFPHLREYLSYVCSLRLQMKRNPYAEAAGIVGIFLLLGSVVALLLGRWIEFAVIGLVVGFATLLGPSRRKPLTEEQQTFLDIQGIASRLMAMMQKNRLHRDFDSASLTVLEEASRYWSQVRRAFGTGFWQSDMLPLQYGEARDRAIVAADEAMFDLLRLYRSHVPEQVENRAAFDYVDEALTSIGISKPQTKAPSPAVWPAKSVAEKLRELAKEAERVSQKVTLDLPGETHQEPTHSLDLALGELRGIHQAEDELRQNLQG